MEATVTEAQQAAPPPRLRERYESEVVEQLTRSSATPTRCRCRGSRRSRSTWASARPSRRPRSSRPRPSSSATIAGQRPNVRRARKSIANFKLREGMPVGVAVTLRGARMWEFLDRLISIAIPRIRDFRGLNPRSFDGRGNYSLGIREQLIFPEIDYDSIDEVRGLDVTITTTAQTDEEAFELLLGARHAVRAGGAARARSTTRPRRRSAATRRRAQRAEAERPRSSSSRRRTPRPTRSASGPRRARKARRAPRAGRAETAEEPTARSSEETEDRWRRRHRASGSGASRSTRPAGYNRCRRCGRPRAYYRKFGLCRLCLRELAHKGYVPGMTKSSW